MSFQRKEKRNPSSRYSKIEEPWLDEEDLPEDGQAGGDVAADGYGVRDSYSRQASYGRPEGYYERRSVPGDGWQEDYGSSSGRDARQGAGGGLCAGR